MTPAERDNAQLGYIIRYCERVRTAIDHFSGNQQAFFTDTVFQDSCSLCLIQIGEAVSRLSDEFIEAHQNIKWHQIRGMRNRLTHDYGAFDAEIVWDALNTQIPLLYEFCKDHFDENL